jgi:hypothetical protein
MSFKIDSQLSENQIESDISSYLGYITPIWSRRFRLISVDEQITGADKLFNRFLPIYLQFKVSHGLNRKTTILRQYLNKPLAKIIAYRNKNNLSGDPILYFELRKKAKKASDFQHNILHGLNNPPSQFALYVAPLTLKISEYETQLEKAWYLKFLPFDPFFRRKLDIYDTLTQKQIILGSNLFLRHHISIPPHTTVSTYKHHYSFSQSGGDLIWHGGELLDDDFRLSNQLAKIFNSFYFNRELGTTLEQYTKFIQDFRFDGYRQIDERDFQPNNPFSIIQEFGRVLKNEYKIKLMILSETKGSE